MKNKWEGLRIFVRPDFVDLPRISPEWDKNILTWILFSDINLKFPINNNKMNGNSVVILHLFVTFIITARKSWIRHQSKLKRPRNCRELQRISEIYLYKTRFILLDKVCIDIKVCFIYCIWNISDIKTYAWQTWHAMRKNLVTN